MIKAFVALTLMGISMQAQVAFQPPNGMFEPANPVVQWNRNLMAIVRTPGAQPGAIHPTRSFAMMHATIYDAVNAIDQTHHAYLVPVSGAPSSASPEAAADAAASEVLIGLYPKLQTTLLSDLDQSLALFPD